MALLLAGVGVRVLDRVVLFMIGPIVAIMLLVELRAAAICATSRNLVAIAMVDAGALALRLAANMPIRTRPASGRRRDLVEEAANAREVRPAPGEGEVVVTGAGDGLERLVTGRRLEEAPAQLDVDDLVAIAVGIGKRRA